jgi:hypothetical protein
MQSLNLNLAFIFALLCITISPTHAEEWRQVKVKDGITVELKKIPGSNFQGFRAHCQVKSTLSALVALLRDEKRTQDWLYQSSSYKQLEQISTHEILTYSTFKTPWPVKARDAVFYSRLRQDLTDKTIVVDLEARPYHLPKNKSFVRIPKGFGFWKFTPVGNGLVNIAYQMEVRPGGRIPSMIANQFVVASPLNTLHKFRDFLQLPEYQQATVEGIVEY